MFEIKEASGIIVEAKVAPKGSGEDRPVLTELKMTIDVDDAVSIDDGAHAAADFLFPNYSLMAAKLSEMNDDDESHPGVKLSTLRKVERMTFAISDEGGEVWRFVNGKLTGGAPTMLIDCEGGASISLKFSTLMSDSQMGQLKGYLGKEVKIAAQGTQPELFGTTTHTPSVAATQTDVEGAMTGAELKELRVERGLSMPQLAELLDCSRKSIQRYESGARFMPVDLQARARQTLAQLAA